MEPLKRGFVDELIKIVETRDSLNKPFSKYAKFRGSRRSVEIILRLPLKKSTKKYLIKRAVFNPLKSLRAGLLSWKINRNATRLGKAQEKIPANTPPSRLPPTSVRPLVERVRRVFGTGPMDNLTGDLSRLRGSDYVTPETIDSQRDPSTPPKWLRRYARPASSPHLYHGSPHVYPIDNFIRYSGVNDVVRNATYFTPDEGVAHHYGRLRQRGLLPGPQSGHPQLPGITISQRPGEYGVYKYDLTGKKFYTPPERGSGFYDNPEWSRYIDLQNRSFSDWLLDKYNIKANEKNRQLLGPGERATGGWVKADQAIPLINPAERELLQAGDPSGFIHKDDLADPPRDRPLRFDPSRTGDRTTRNYHDVRLGLSKETDPDLQRSQKYESGRIIKAGPLTGDWRHGIPSRLDFDMQRHRNPGDPSDWHPHLRTKDSILLSASEPQVQFMRERGVDGFTLDDTSGRKSFYPEYAAWDASDIKPVPGQQVPNFEGPLISTPGRPPGYGARFRWPTWYLK